MLSLSNKELAFIFSPDMRRLKSGEYITYMIEKELVSYEFLYENDIDLLMETGSIIDEPYIWN